MNRFMGKLLKGENFDGFLLKEGFLRTNIEYRFQGQLFAEYFDTSEQEKLEEKYDGILELRVDNNRTRSMETIPEMDGIQFHPAEVFQSFYKEMRSQDMSSEEEQLLHEILRQTGEVTE